MSLTSWLKSFGRTESATFDTMSPKEKGEFLSNDLIERMIRVEQRVSSKMGKPVHYRATQYYKSLSSAQKAKFESHLKNKGKKVFLLSLLAFSALFGLGTITGNAISDISSQGPGLISILTIFVGLFLIAILLRTVYERKHRHERLSGVHSLIEKTIKN